MGQVGSSSKRFDESVPYQIKFLIKCLLKFDEKRDYGLEMALYGWICADIIAFGMVCVCILSNRQVDD